MGEPQITFAGASGESEGIILTQGDLGVRCTAEGAAEYHILFTDESGATVYEHTYAGDSTGMTIPANILTTNMVYELSVTEMCIRDSTDTAMTIAPPPHRSAHSDSAPNAAPAPSEACAAVNTATQARK